MSYDSWLEQPYQDMYAAADAAEKLQQWIIENSTYVTECCDCEIDWEDVSFDKNDRPMPMACPECKKEAVILMEEASIDDDDYSDPEDWDECMCDDCRFVDR